MKNHIYILLFLMLGSDRFSGQGFGEILYPRHNGGVKMSCAFTAKLHPQDPGYLMAGFQPIKALSGFNFVIDRVNPGGIPGNNIYEFQNEYHIFANSTEECDFKPLPVNNCAGVSVIETSGPVTSPFPLSPPLRYALAGAFNSGCFFSLLDQNGNPLFSTSFIFPNPPYTTITKPIIIECERAKGDYIITGSIDNLMYAFRIDVTGNILWNRFYPITGVPYDMIESPYGPNPNTELIVVGKTTSNSFVTGMDGFIMNLNENTGNVINYQRVNAGGAGFMPTHNQYFTTICKANPVPIPFIQQPGFMLGGYTEPGSANYKGHAWTYKVDTILNMTHTHVYTPSADSIAGEIVDIVVRKRSVGTLYDYFSLIKSNVGMMVICSDGGPNYNYLTVFRESVYNLPGKLSNPCNLGFINDPSMPDAGLQIFGTDDTGFPSSHYLAKSYFSGETGCSYTQTPINCHLATNSTIEGVQPFGGLTECRNFFILTNESESFNQVCGPYSTIANASNARMIGEKEEVIGIIQANIYPNPVKDRTTISYESDFDSEVQIDLYSALGQYVSTIQSGQVKKGKQQIDIDLSTLNINAGIYFIQCAMNGNTSTQKLIYTGN